MSEILLLSIGIVLIIEGLFYFFLANNMKKFINILSLVNPKIIKNISAACSLIGLCLIYFTFKFYNN